MTAERDDSNSDTEGLSGPGDLIRASLGLIRREFWVLALVGVALVATEFGLRLLRPELAGLVYAPDRTGGHPVILSEDGLRVPPGAAAGTGRLQVLGLGDSATFGTGVAAEDTWPLRLNTLMGPEISVVNGGSEGSDPRRLTHGLATTWGEADAPDAILLLVTSNMINGTEFRKNKPLRTPADRAEALAREQRAYTRGPKQRISETLQGSTLWKAGTLSLEYLQYGLGLLSHRVRPDALISPLLAHGWVQPDLPGDYTAAMWTKFEAELRTFHQEVQKRGTCLVIGYLPPRFMISDQRGDNLKFVPKSRLRDDPAPRVAALARDIGVPFVSGTAAMRAARATDGPFARPLYIPGDYTHLDADGHAQMAEAFTPALRLVLEDGGGC